MGLLALYMKIQSTLTALVTLIAFIALCLFCACKKHSAGNNGNGGGNQSYYKDIIINEKLESGNAAPWQNALGYFQLKSDPTTQIMVASRGTQEYYDGSGFRMASINKVNGTVNWVKSYDLPDEYTIQFVSCAAIDNNDNIWIGGHSYAGTGVAGILFLAELDKSGNMIWSGSLSNYQGWRSYSLAALSNGDIALFAKSGSAFVVLRLTANQQLVWSTIVDNIYPNIDDDFYTNNHTISASPENHGLVETDDGSIYVAASGNTTSFGIDRLYRLDASGKVQFAKMYRQAFSGATHPVQLIKAGTNNLLMADQFFASGYVFPSPTFNLLSLDGEVQVSKAYPLNQSPVGIGINEMNYYQGNIYFSSCGDFAFNTYVLDMNLNLKSAIETVADTAATTDRGGISLFDSAQNSLYYVCNFGGGSTSESNGFELLRNGPTGKPCDTTNAGDALPLLLDNTQINVTSDTAAMNNVVSGPTPVFTPLNWRSYVVTVTATENICGK